LNTELLQFQGSYESRVKLKTELEAQTGNLISRAIQLTQIEEDFKFIRRLGKQTAEGLVFEVEVKVSDEYRLPFLFPLANRRFVVKLFYNLYGNKNDALNKNHRSDLQLLLGLPYHPNVLKAYFQMKFELTLQFAKKLPITSSEQDCSFLFQQLSEAEEIYSKLNKVEQLPDQLLPPDALLSRGIWTQALILPLLIKTLTEELDEVNKLPIEKALHFGIQLTEAVSHLHRHGFCHMDIKPDNIMLNREGEIVLIDFGMAVPIGTASIVGNTFYYPGNQPQVKVNPAMDIFAVGCVIYEMISGREIFTPDLQKSIRTGDRTVKNPFRNELVFDITLPEALQRLIQKMLQEDENLRPTSNFIIEEFDRLLINSVRLK